MDVRPDDSLDIKDVENTAMLSKAAGAEEEEGGSPGFRRRKVLFLGPEDPGRSQRPAQGPGLVGSTWIGQVEAAAGQSSTSGISSLGEASPLDQPPGSWSPMGRRRPQAGGGGQFEALLVH